MEFKFCLTLALGFLFPVSPAFASPLRSVYSSQAQGVNSPLIQLKLGPGSGMNISLPKGETIKKVWLDDKSRVGLSFDENLCQWNAQQQQECKDEAPTMIHLRQIMVNFQNMTHSRDGSTLLTVRAQGVSGRKTYLFQIFPIRGLSEFANLDILSDSEKPPQLLSDTLPSHLPESTDSDIPPNEVNSKLGTSSPFLPPQPLKRNADLQSSPPGSANVVISDSTRVASQGQSTDTATTLAFGLLASIQKGELSPGTTIWDQAQNALSRLRKGESIGDALSGSELNSLTFHYFITLGQQESLMFKRNIQEGNIKTDNSSPNNTVNSAPIPSTSSTTSQINSQSKLPVVTPQFNVQAGSPALSFMGASG